MYIDASEFLYMYISMWMHTYICLCVRARIHSCTPFLSTRTHHYTSTHTNMRWAFIQLYRVYFLSLARALSLSLYLSLYLYIYTYIQNRSYRYLLLLSPSLSIYTQLCICLTCMHTATHCNTLQHTATHCNTLQHTATHLFNMHASLLDALVLPHHSVEVDIYVLCWVVLG